MERATIPADQLPTTTSFRASARRTSRRRTRLVTLVAGWSLLVVGTVLLVLPGPGLPLVLAGLALLGREQPWALHLRVRVEGRARKALARTLAVLPLRRSAK